MGRSASSCDATGFLRLELVMSQRGLFGNRVRALRRALRRGRAVQVQEAVEWVAAGPWTSADVDLFGEADVFLRSHRKRGVGYGLHPIREKRTTGDGRTRWVVVGYGPAEVVRDRSLSIAADRQRQVAAGRKGERK